MNIVKGKDNPILRAVSKPVPAVTKKLLKILKEMEPAMFGVNGIGLAAPQVGINQRFAICLLNKNRVVPIINPEIVWKSPAMETAEEGCLSLPGHWGKVARHKKLHVKFLDKKGNENVLELSGLNARIVQHEVDHLDATLFIDRAEGEVRVETPEK